MSETNVRNTASKSTKIGVVDSDKRSKTRRVVVSFMVQHSKYNKFVSKRSVLHVHDEHNEAAFGDTVEIAPCRPVSKTKSWKLVRIVEKNRKAVHTAV